MAEFSSQLCPPIASLRVKRRKKKFFSARVSFLLNFFLQLFIIKNKRAKHAAPPALREFPMPWVHY